jgi:hypothetical protein
MLRSARCVGCAARTASRVGAVMLLGTCGRPGADESVGRRRVPRPCGATGRLSFVSSPLSDACDMDPPAIPVNTPYHLDLDEEKLFPPFAGLPNEQTGDVSEAVLAGAPWYFFCEIGTWIFTSYVAFAQA